MHCPVDVSKLNMDNFPIQRNLVKSDYLIVCGDMGIVWDGSKEDKYWQKWFNERNYTTLFVDGNHENHPMLSAFPIVEFCGGRAHKIADSIYHLMRGEIYEIDGKTFFCFGGAESTDKYRRTEGQDWWPEEVASLKEMEHGNNSLFLHGDTVDYIITHDCPFSIKQAMLKFEVSKDPMTSYFDFLNKSIKFKHWYFGHYHRDEKILDRYTCLYQTIEQII